MSTVRTIVATFTASTTSGEIDLGEGTLVGIELSSGFQGTTITFQAASAPTAQGGTYQDVFALTGAASFAAAVLTITAVAASKSLTLSPDILSGYRWIKLVAGTGTYTVNCMVRNKL